MATTGALKWDQTGERLYETGTKMGVVYPYATGESQITIPTDLSETLSSTTNSKYGPGVAWNGLTAVTESPSGAEATDLYADDIKYLTMRSAETLGGTIEAYMYPDEFAVLDGTASLIPGVSVGQQSRSTFGFCYRTTLGNDTQLNDYSYKLHLLYGCTVSPSERAYATINDSPEAITFSWELTTTPISFSNGGKTYSTANMTIDVSKLGDKKDNIKKLEECLYGTESSTPFLPLPDEVIKILNAEVSP